MLSINQNIKKVLKEVSDVRNDFIKLQVDNIRKIINNEDLLASFKREREKLFENGNVINIFDWLGFIKHLENPNSDILCQLLNLKYSYNSPFSDLLSSFYDEVIFPKLSSDEKKHFSREKFITSNVEREKRIDLLKRIDLFFSNDEFCIPIEIKIDADDTGENQCLDYLMFAERYNKTKNYPPILFYLTKYGSKPSEISIKESDNHFKYLKLISWNTDILNWVINLVKNSKTPDKLRYFLIDYENVIKEFCGEKTMNINEEAKKIIFESKDSLSATLEIINTFEEAKTQNLRLFLDELKGYLSNLITNGDLMGLTIQDVFENYEDQIEKYYKAKSYPFINLRTEYNDGNAWLSIRLEFSPSSRRAYVGIVSHSQDGREQISTDRLNEYCSKLIDNKDWWWLCWKFIKLNNCSLDFDNNQDLYVELFNNKDGREKREEYYKVIAGMIKDYYLDLQKNDEDFHKYSK